MIFLTKITLRLSICSSKIEGFGTNKTGILTTSSSTFFSPKPTNFYLLILLLKLSNLLSTFCHLLFQYFNLFTLLIFLSLILCWHSLFTTYCYYNYFDFIAISDINIFTPIAKSIIILPTMPLYDSFSCSQGEPISNAISILQVDNSQPLTLIMSYFSTFALSLQIQVSLLFIFTILQLINTNLILFIIDFRIHELFVYIANCLSI